MESPAHEKPCGCDIRDGKLEVCRPKMLAELHAKVKERMTDNKGSSAQEFEIRFPFWASGDFVFKGENLYLKLHASGPGPDSFHWEITADGHVTSSQSYFTDDFGDGDPIWQPCPLPPDIYVQAILKSFQPETPVPIVQKLPQERPTQTLSSPQGWKTRFTTKIKRALSWAA